MQGTKTTIFSLGVLNCLIRMLLTAVIFLVCTSFHPEKDTSAQLAIARIQYIYFVKKTIGDAAWSGFGNKKYNIPLLYYTDNATFISNPGEQFLRQFHPKLVFENKTTKIFRLGYRIDNISFHMHVTIGVGEDSTAYDYYPPYIRCSSREEFETATGYKTNTRLWVSMVLHECFHGFQFLHEGYTKEAIETGFILPSAGDSLQQLYRSKEWYKGYVDSENNLLLKAIACSNKKGTDSLLRQFFTVRSERRLRAKSEINHDIALLEKSFETFEGTARFIEAYVLEHPVNDRALSKIDSSFTIEQKVAGFTSNIPQYLYKTEVSDRYFYAMGYNEARLLKKMNISYTSMLFNQPALTLEDILQARFRHRM